jgi:ParB-like chromosome segregation protein Spo0J
MQSHHPIRNLPIDQIEIDPDSPHHDLGTREEEHQLRESIKRFGVMSALLVSENGPDRYLIIDGYRRFMIARELGIKSLACVIHPPMESADREILRFQLQMTFKPLTKAERTKQRRRLRDLGVTSPEEAA